MNNKKRMGLIIAIGLFSLCYCMYSQSDFTFTYDASGNMTLRTYVVNMQASQARKSNPGKDSSNVVALSDKMKVTIFPNPTKGELKIQVSGVWTMMSILVGIPNKMHKHVRCSTLPNMLMDLIMMTGSTIKINFFQEGFVQIRVVKSMRRFLGKN